MAKRKTTKQFILRAIEKHGLKYNYSEVAYKGNKIKVKIWCHKCEDYFWQSPSSHLLGHNCNKCTYKERAENRLLTTEEFINKAIKKHIYLYEYNKVIYINSRKNVQIWCKKCKKYFWQTPNSHLSGKGCHECGRHVTSAKLSLTTEQFICKSACIHPDKYNYRLVHYINAKTKIKIFCLVCKIYFLQTAGDHIQGKGCSVCGYNHINKKRTKTTEQFIEEAICKQLWKYNYKKVDYKNTHKPVKIFCLKCKKYFNQTPTSHLQGAGCSKCRGRFPKKYSTNNIPLYNTYAWRLSPYGIYCRKNIRDENILEVRCMYCDKWYLPSLRSVVGKIASINGRLPGGYNFYCSDNCKKACPTFGQKKYPKGFKKATSREVQPALRKLVLKRDNYKCQICEASIEERELHCHHLTGVELNPIESADVDNCITLCKKHHKQVHKLPDCGYHELKCKK